MRSASVLDGAHSDWNGDALEILENNSNIARQQRELRGSSRSPKIARVFFHLSTICQFLLLVCVCSGSDSASSSFQRPPPPPPPPGSSFTQPGTPAAGKDYGGEYPAAGDYYRGQQQQQGEPPLSPPPQYQDEYYGQGIENRDEPPQSDPSSASAPPAAFSPPRGQPNEGGPAVPIHYEFPISEDDEGGRRRPRRYDDEEDFDDDRERRPATSSARKDLVTQHWSTKRGKVQIQAVIGLIGYGSGNFVAKSLIGESDAARWTGYFWAVFMIVSTWFRTPMGELSRAAGLSLILVLQRTQRIRKEYPTWRYVGASVGIMRGGPRDARGRPRGPRPFPPARNPWRYSPRSPRDPDFNMVYALVSMAVVGSTVGGNMPFVPNWIGALAGAATFAFACTWQNSHRGDLARTMGMRVVRAVTELWEIQADLQMIPKATVVSSQVIDKAMILDRKHRVKDRFLSFANKGYAQASKVAEQIQQQQRGGKNKNRNDENDDDEGGDDRRRGRDRRRDDDDGPRRGRDRDADRRGRDSRDRGRFGDRDDDRRPRRPRSDYDKDERYDSRGRPGPEERRRPSRSFDGGDDDRDRDFSSGRRGREEYDDDDDRGSRDDDKSDRDRSADESEDESDKKSKGFFFRRK